MPLELVWTKRAKATFQSTASYLLNNWSQDVLQHFADKTNSVLDHVASGRVKGIPVKGRANTFQILITKHNYLYYRVKPRKQQMHLLVFWNTNRNPKKLWKPK